MASAGGQRGTDDPVPGPQRVLREYAGADRQRVDAGLCRRLCHREGCNPERYYAVLRRCERAGDLRAGDGLRGQRPVLRLWTRAELAEPALFVVWNARLQHGHAAGVSQNSDYPNNFTIDGQLDYPNVFEQLDNAGATWKIYYSDLLPIAALINYVAINMEQMSSNVVAFDNFFTDVANGTLPSFSLIDPNYQMFHVESFVAPTSNHPGDSSAFSDSGIPISISCGERLLANVFQALTANTALFEKTLLIVTYDEHGGLFDHVPPPPAVSPFQPGQVINFNYDSYGVRVPALFINPYVQPGLIPPLSAPALPTFDHTSVLATLRDQFGLSGSLSPRVDIAPTFMGLINPSQQPISPPTIAVPQCMWSPPSGRGLAEPIVRNMIGRGSRLGPSRER